MSDDKSNPPPPTNPGYNYGAVPSTGPPDEAQAMAPPPVQQNYPQDPPPKYEPPKGQDYPPQQYQPQTQYPPGYQAPPVQHTTVIVADTNFGPVPHQCQCPNCQALVVTSIEHESGGLTWLAAGLICILGCWVGCCFIPFCIPDLQDVVHRCPNCHRHIGTYRRL